MSSYRGLAQAMILVSLWSVGCSRSTTVTAPDGSQVTVQQDGGKMTVKNDKGTFEVDQKNGATSMKSTDGKSEVKINAQQGVDLDKEFGLPGYPGAKQEMTVNQNGPDAAKMATLTTADAFDKVAAFYKEKLGKVKGANITEANTPDQKMLNITLEEATRTVNATVFSAEGGARIQLTATAKAAPVTPKADAEGASAPAPPASDAAPPAPATQPPADTQPPSGSSGN